MACCGNREKDNKNQIPNLSGELRIWNEDKSITTTPLNEQEVWMIRTALKETLKRAVNDPGYVNGKAKALLISLVEKIDPKDPACEAGCECM
jgi:hypothetical protein